MEKNESKSTVVAKINNVNIVVIENGEKRVAIKPICEALGIAHQPQFEKLKSDPILSSVVTMVVTTGKDKKEYEMVTIPFKYVFGWLFRIDSRKVSEEARETVLRYQMECYEALWSHFSGYSDFVEYQNRKIQEQLSIVEAVKFEFNSAKDRLKDANDDLQKARNLTFDIYRAEISQQKIPFDTTESSKKQEQ